MPHHPTEGLREAKPLLPIIPPLQTNYLRGLGCCCLERGTQGVRLRVEKLEGKPDLGLDLIDHNYDLHLYFNIEGL
jgi:hypothetical protein